MKTNTLTNEELQKIYFGAFSFAESEGGYLRAFQYTKAQMEYFRRTESYWYDRSMASSAKTMECITEATEFSFEYKIFWQGSYDCFELFANGEFVRSYKLEDLPRQGSLRFEIPQKHEGKTSQNIVIYLPVDATVGIRNFTVNAPVRPAKKGMKVLWLGDSITQGFGPFRPSGTYVSVANRELNFDILNQGIAGYVYDKGSIMPMEGYTPKRIIVSLGTNQYDAPDLKPVEEFYEKLFEVYGTQIPVLTITPVWRDDFDTPNDREHFFRFCEHIREICERYPNITIADGFKLIPHNPEYYVDGLHPNEAGAGLYGKNLIKEIKGWL